jgi:hypothetical protein
MSKFLDINELVIDNQDCFVATLREDVKFNHKLGAAVEVHDVATNLFGYHGDMRPEKAEIIIRREHVGGSSNDIGFKRTENGFKPIISEFDSHQYNAAWQDLLGQRYAERAYEANMFQQGFALQSKTPNTDGTTRMEFAEIGGF